MPSTSNRCSTVGNIENVFGNGSGMVIDIKISFTKEPKWKIFCAADFCYFEYQFRDF